MTWRFQIEFATFSITVMLHNTFIYILNSFHRTTWIIMYPIDIHVEISSGLVWIHSPVTNNNVLFSPDLGIGRSLNCLATVTYYEMWAIIRRCILHVFSRSNVSVFWREFDRIYQRQNALFVEKVQYLQCKLYRRKGFFPIIIPVKLWFDCLYKREMSSYDI